MAIDGIDKRSGLADWTDDQLNALRQRADPLADGLVARMYEQPATGGPGLGRLGYNHLLDLTDTLQKAPALAFTNRSEFQRQWQAAPRELADYFDPIELPAWADPAKLQLASNMWMDNSIGMLVVLFFGSLPACYLMARGIPALYQTDKFASRRYISQRIYETGLMLDAVMGAGGFQTIADVAGDGDGAMLSALNRHDPTGGWTMHGRSLRRTAPLANHDKSRLNNHLVETDRNLQPKRFLWGAGYVTVRKVRFLHASMRYMLQHPDRFKPAGANAAAPVNLAEAHARRPQAWDRQSLGLPVNQEDLAYTLLTFGYVIPAGLDRWGFRFTPEQKHAFLHLWRLVGHVIGVEDELMTDDWNEAERIYRRIQQHQAVSSADGIALTNVLMEFIEDYLPRYFGANKALPPLAVRDLLGAEADKVLSQPVLQAARRPSQRALWLAVRCVLWSYGWIRAHLFRPFPKLSAVFTHLLHRVAEELIESLWGAYARKPFYVPVDETTWVPQYGASPDFLKRLRHWRQQVFDRVFLSLGSVITGALGAAATLALWGLGIEGAWIAGLISVASFGLSYVCMSRLLPRLFAQRPAITDLPPLEHQG